MLIAEGASCPMCFRQSLQCGRDCQSGVLCRRFCLIASCANGYKDGDCKSGLLIVVADMRLRSAIYLGCLSGVCTGSHVIQ